MSPLPAVTPTRTTTTEAELFIAYRAASRTEPCVCGGSITAPWNDEELIRIAVQGHQMTARHRAWRTWQEQPE